MMQAHGPARQGHGCAAVQDLLQLRLRGTHHHHHHPQPQLPPLPPSLPPSLHLSQLPSPPPSLPALGLSLLPPSLLSLLVPPRQGEQDDDKALAASQCLDALNTLLQSVRDHKDILRACEDDVVPVLALVLGPDGTMTTHHITSRPTSNSSSVQEEHRHLGPPSWPSLKSPTDPGPPCLVMMPAGDYYEYLESALDLLTCLTFYAHDISPQLWQLFPLIQQVFDR